MTRDPYDFDVFHVPPLPAGITEEMVSGEAGEFVDPSVTVGEFVARRTETQIEALISSEQGTLLPPAGLGILAAKVDAGKTTWAVDVLLHAVAGLDCCGLSFPRPLRVLVVENEGPREAFRAKIERRLAGWPHPTGGLRIWDEEAHWGRVRASDDSVRGRLQEVIAEHDTDLVVADTLTRFGMRGNGTPEETREFVELLAAAGLGRTVAFLLLHHPRTRVEPGEPELEQLAGAWPPHADLILVLQKLGGNRGRLSFPKTRWAQGQRPASILAFDPETETYAYVGDDVQEERDLAAELAELMDDGDWWTVNQLRAPKDKGGVGAAPEAVKQALADDRFEGVNGVEIGRRSDATYYRLLEASRPPGDARDASPLGSQGGKRHPSPPSKRGDGDVTLDADPDAPGDDAVDEGEIERLADLARDAVDVERSLSDPHTHICFARGCNEIVTGRYHCDRHEEIAERQRASIARRASERAAERKKGKP